MIGIAGIAALALATWSVQDPSFSHATNAPVRNALGLVGAASADLMMQILGIATVALLLPVASGAGGCSRIGRSSGSASGQSSGWRHHRGRGLRLMPCAEQVLAAADRPRRRRGRLAVACAGLGFRTALRRSPFCDRDHAGCRCCRGARARGGLRLRREDDEEERKKRSRRGKRPSGKWKKTTKKSASRAASSRSAGSIISSTA